MKKREKDLINPLHAITTPIYRVSTFGFDSTDEFKKVRKDIYTNKKGFNYSRITNPTCDVLETKLAELEHGEAALTTSCGMGAIGSTLLDLVQSGDHILMEQAVYDGTVELCKIMLSKFGVETTFIDFNDIELFKKSLKPNTKVVYFESPTNPLMKINDISLISKLAHQYNKDIKVIFDNTIPTPVLQKPLTLGVDIVVHSLTKYINGHGDIIGGAVIGSLKDINHIRFNARKFATGSVLSPEDAFLVLRGIETLELRMKQHSDSSLKIAQYLESLPYIKKVNYPGLKSNPNYALAKKQMHNMYSGVISFETKLTYQQTKDFVDNLQHFKVAVSLGDPISLIQHYSALSIAKNVKKTTFCRMSIGLEDVNVLLDDIKQAFRKVL